MALKINYRLQNGKYKIKEILKRDIFGITYLVFDNSLDKDLIIKEFFPPHLARRSSNDREVLSLNGKERDFLEDKKVLKKNIKTLSKLKHTSILKIYDIFEENNTIYYVTEYINGTILWNHIENNPMSQADILEMVSYIASAVEIIHEKKLFHGNLTPYNIILTSENKPIIIDFIFLRYGFHKYENSGYEKLDYTCFLPDEQFSDKSSKDSYTDIYTLASTIYMMATGKAPLPLRDRRDGKKLVDIENLYTDNFKDAIYHAMELSVRDRTQTIKEFTKALFKDKIIKEPLIEKNIEVIDDKKNQIERIIKSKELKEKEKQVEIKEDKQPIETNIKDAEAHKNREKIVQTFSHRKASSNEFIYVFLISLMSMFIFLILSMNGRENNDPIETYLKECNNGNMNSCNSLGFLYYEGNEVAKDNAKAVELYQKACDGGSSAGCYNLGYMYENGEGVMQQYTKAVELYKKACDGGNSVSCTNLKNLQDKMAIINANLTENEPIIIDENLTNEENRTVDANVSIGEVSSVDGAAAFASSCAACHGEDGKANIGGAKTLAGLSAADVEAKLNAYKAGTVQSPTAAVMNGQVAALDDATIKALAAHVATFENKTIDANYDSENLKEKAYQLMTGQRLQRDSDIRVKKNSKGDIIYCLPDMSVCKTEDEINGIQNSTYNQNDSMKQKAHQLMTGQRLQRDSDIRVKKNSKGDKIYCLSDMSVCKTEEEVNGY